MSKTELFQQYTGPHSRPSDLFGEPGSSGEEIPVTEGVKDAMAYLTKRVSVLEAKLAQRQDLLIDLKSFLEALSEEYEGNREDIARVDELLKAFDESNEQL